MPIFLNGIKNDIFDDFIYQDVIFSLQYSKSIFAINLKGTEYGRSEKYSMDKDFEAFIYCDKGIYKSIKIFG